jgi:two-component system, OmpR family, sensor histidine kinase BaeS
MRTSLAYKIFCAFLLTSLTVASLTITTLRFFGHRNFAEYIEKMEIEKISDLIDMLSLEYQTSGGWNRLHANPRLWRGMVRSAGRSKIEQNVEGDERKFEFHRRSNGAHVEPRPVPRSEELIDVRSRIFLLGEGKNLVAGRLANVDGSILHQIVLDGRQVGWLGIHRRELQLTPLEVAFLKKQNELFYLIGAGIFILTAIASFFLSKHLLAPIKQLMKGTRALASREFGTRIEVPSRDELGRLAADFNTMAETLEQYEEMRKRWISDISHELRTPLSILRGEIEALQDGVRTISEQAMDSLYSEVLHLGKIVNDLHELSMADSGSLNLNLRPLDPVQVLLEVLRPYRSRFGQAQITLKENLGTGTTLSTLGDADRLVQLFSNILENVLRYADAPGTLQISQIVDKTELTLIFEDSGPGVPEECVGRLFERLYRVDSARTRSKGGSGLGLAICKTIVESHGGRISAANQSTGGLRITVVLPIGPISTGTITGDLWLCKSSL